MRSHPPFEDNSGAAMESRASTRPGKVLALCAGLLLTVSACGPTAGQLQERDSSASAAPSATGRGAAEPSRTAHPTQPPAPVPATTAPPTRVGVTGSQAGMPQPVQDACQWLLRRDPEPASGAEAGACVSAAMAAGGGGIQTLRTDTSWLPAGTYSVRFASGPDFAMTLQDTDTDLSITIREGQRVLHKENQDISADRDGTAEEAYAAILADAAELTVRPEKVAALLAPAEEVAVRYGAVLDGEPCTQISGSFDTGDLDTGDLDTGDLDTGDAQQRGNETGPPDGSSAVLPAGSFSLCLDDFYRPLKIEITGLNQGITSTITAVNAQWGTRPLS
ncbi:hypothetical protein [Arthrobacter sp. zg-Y844]|uniref:hypothetical protein n=1 Tax=Arthrobacter sp. zg-Y844 TaxID=2964612 RepID=UPI0021026681|nr:hypothetical protein [Arthrobacter sp. zg-Y844]MCQ1986851.1 hypothetical protein [Arthrobacter sp. zg-Y844]